MKSFKMAMPKSTEGAVKVLGEDFSKRTILAGGTDLLAGIKEHLIEPEVVVNLKSVAGLDEIISRNGNLEIGSLVKLDTLARHQLAQENWPALIESVANTATPQIRNVATIGGNLCQRPRCWYFRNENYHCTKKGGTTCYAKEGENDYLAIFGNETCEIVHPSNLAGPLMAYGAQVEILGPQGTKVIDLEDFFVSPEINVARENVLKANEIVTKIILPSGSANKNSAYYETREKQSFDWALCGASVSLEMNGKNIKSARVILNAVAPTPVRRKDLEAMLQGQKVSQALFTKVAKTAVESATPSAKNEYKVSLLRTVIERGLRKASEA